MKFYHKINQYILERYPVLWNTQFVWISLLGLLLHLGYFAIGYNVLNAERIKGYNVNGAFFETVFFWIYLVICLLTFIFMSFRFYGHNPFRHYYPLSRFYFWKIFGVLLFYVLLFITVFISFENGMRAKSNRLLSEKQFLQDVEAVNKSYAFLFNDINDYYILNRAYPAPFPLDDISNFELGYDTITELPIKHGIDRTKPFVTINDIPFQFGHIKTILPDSCTTKQIIQDIVDVSSVYGLEEYSLLNFNRIYVQYPEIGYGEFTMRNNLNNMGGSDSVNRQALLSTWHTLYRNKDKNGIQKILENLVVVCNRYRIPHQLNPEKMTRDILLQDLLKTQLVRTGFYDYHDLVHGVANSTSSTVNKNYETQDKYVERENRDDNYSVDLEQFANMARNRTQLEFRMGWRHLQANEMWAFLFVSMAMALALLLFKYVQTRVILLGVIIAGIIGSLFGVLFYLADKHIHDNQQGYKDTMLWFLSMAVVVAIFSMSLISIYTGKIKKRIAELGFVSAVFSSIFLPMLLLIGIMLLSSYQQKDPCSDYMSTLHRFEPQPWQFAVGALLSVQLIFMLLRRLQGKME